MALELNELIKSRAHRILKKVEGYKSLQANDIDTLDTHDLLLQEEEELIGIYKINHDNFTEMIVVTTAGLHVFVVEWLFVEYRAIADISIPLTQEKDKALADRILVHLQGRNTIEIPIKGGQGRMRDAWSFLHFLRRIRSDVQKRQN